jgi:hypothetical protein
LGQPNHLCCVSTCTMRAGCDNIKRKLETKEQTNNPAHKQTNKQTRKLTDLFLCLLGAFCLFVLFERIFQHIPGTCTIRSGLNIMKSKNNWWVLSCLLLCFAFPPASELDGREYTRWHSNRGYLHWQNLQCWNLQERLGNCRCCHYVCGHGVFVHNT